MLLTMGKSWSAKLFHCSPDGAAEKLLADAESGDAQARFDEAQHTLGLRCRRAGFKDSPEGAPESTWEAYRWFGLASAQGCKGSEAEFERLAMCMTQEQVTEGNRRVATFPASATDW
jgi:TPR repeat protein